MVRQDPRERLLDSIRLSGARILLLTQQPRQAIIDRVAKAVLDVSRDIVQDLWISLNDEWDRVAFDAMYDHFHSLHTNFNLFFNHASAPIPQIERTATALVSEARRLFDGGALDKAVVQKLQAAESVLKRARKVA
jgi:hypothetical protein